MRQFYNVSIGARRGDQIAHYALFFDAANKALAQIHASSWAYDHLPLDLGWIDHDVQIMEVDLEAFSLIDAQTIGE